MFSFFSVSQELFGFFVLLWDEVDASSVTKLLCNSEGGTGEN